MAVNIRKLNVCLAIGAVGLAASAPATAVADDDMTVSLSGGAMQSELGSEKLGPSDDSGFDDSFGLYGSVKVLRDISPGWDWSASASVLNFVPDTVYTTDDGPDGPFEGASGIYEFDAGFTNFDIGRKWETARTSFRVGAGVEALSTSDDKGLTIRDVYNANEDEDEDEEIRLGTFKGNGSRSYLGAGLRLSAEGKARLAADSPFSVYGGANMAATRGKYSYEKGFSAMSTGESGTEPEGSLQDTYSETGGMNHSTFEIGLEYAPTSNTAFRVGVRRDIFTTDAKNANMEGYSKTIEADTAYVGVAISF